MAKEANVQTEISDEDLMRRYQRGDSSAFEILYKRHSGKVYGYLKTRLENRQQADEVFQAVFLKFHQARQKYDPRFPVLQWLFVISKSVLIDHFRKEKRQVDVEDGISPETVPEVVSQTGHSPSLHRQEDMIALASLSDEQKQIIQWRVTDDWTYGQIASQLNRSEQNVRQIFSRSLKKLRTQLRAKQSTSKGEL